MKFYLKHILTREITTNTRDCLAIILCIGSFPEAIWIFIKEKKEKISKDLFPIIPFLLLQHTSYWKAYVYLGTLFCLQVKGTDAIEFEKKFKWSNETMKRIKKEQSCLIFSREHQVYNWIAQCKVKINCCWISHA